MKQLTLEEYKTISKCIGNFLKALGYAFSVTVIAGVIALFVYSFSALELLGITIFFTVIVLIYIKIRVDEKIADIEYWRRQRHFYCSSPCGEECTYSM